MLAGVPVAYATLLTALAGLGFECAQRWPRGWRRGYFSWRDLVADAFGAFAVYGWGVLWR